MAKDYKTIGVHITQPLLGKLEAAALAHRMKPGPFIKRILEDWEADGCPALKGLSIAQPAPATSTSTRVIHFPDTEEWHTLPCYAAAAGSPTDGDEFEAQFQRNYGDDYFAVRVIGNSMEPEIKDGSTIIMLKKERWTRSHLPKKGDIYCVMIEGERVLKRYNRRDATPEEIEENKALDESEQYLLSSPNSKRPRVGILESDNPDYPERVVKRDTQLLGWYDPDNQPET
ncbi:S24 family peptidase [Cerasicoccus frondis]|uniref:S24 family peptidase n=1 Tax=Cerasicoccus frondis TaxID=490090 RepID=UPI00285252B0|nr:S24 family peptidase [Cerasicoccus frondis]